MKLAIDLQACQTDSRERGIGRYSMSLSAHLAQQARDGDELILLLDSVAPERLRDLRRRLRHCGVRAGTAAFGYPNLANFTDMHPPLVDAAGLLKGRLLEATRADALLVTSFFEVGAQFTTRYDWEAVGPIPKAVIAYDLIPILFPERYLQDGHFISTWYRQKVEEFKRFDLFLAISEATRRDLIEHLGIPDDRIRVIGAGLDFELASGDDRPHHDQDRELRGLGIVAPFVLVVGNADWRKNSLGALEAFAALPAELRSRHQLVFTRVGDDVRSALEGPYADIASQVVVAGSVPETTLSLLYKRCKVFFFPSFYEGFGLPVIEAMALGAPVLSSNAGALAEVMHHPDALFDPADKRGAAAVLQRALADEAFRQHLLDGAREHALSFTWEKCAAEAFEPLRRLAHDRNSGKVVWQPSERDVERLADAIIATGAPGEEQLKDGLQAIANQGRRRVLVDITEVVRLDARTGIQRVVRNYCKGLIEEAARSGAFEVEPICWTEQGIRYARSFARERLGIALHGGDHDVEVLPNDIAFMVDSSWWSPQRFDDFHSKVRMRGGEIVWMVYDLVPLQTPELCDPVMPPIFKAWLAHVAATADGCICISESTRCDLERYFGQLPHGSYRPWTRAVHLGSDLESGFGASPPSAPARDAVAKMEGVPYVVAVGTIEPRKDYPTIVSAFDRLWSSGVDVGLVIVGKEGWSVAKFARDLRRHKKSGKRLFWMEGAPDADVQHVLSHASAFVQASLAEGFGLPVVESGSKGTPLILSDLQVFREIAGDQAVYFPVKDDEALAAAVQAGLRDGWKRPVGVKTVTWKESSCLLANMLLR